MALKPIEILKDLIEGTAHTITIDSVVSLGGGSYKLLTENTLYLRTKKKVTISGTEYEITDFEMNVYITVSATSGADVPVVVSSFDIASPLFVWGNPQMVSAEIVKRQKNHTITWPYIWALELARTERVLNPAVAVKTTKSFVLFFLDSNNKKDWTIESHYDNAVYTQGNYVGFFEDMLRARRDLFDTDSITYTQDDLVNFGDYIVDKGMEERILNDNVTGVGLQIDIPFIVNECSTTVITSRCIDASETLNGVGVSPIPSGGMKDIIVQNDAATPVQVGTILTDTPTSLVVSVPAGGSGPTNIAYLREAYKPGDNETTVNGALGWYKSNTSIFNIPWSSGLAPILDITDDSKLITNNTFGNLNRVTNDKGAQNYADVGGGLTSDGATANVAIDHYTGKRWYLLSLHAGTQHWDDSVTTAQAFTVTAYDSSTYGNTSYDQWHMPTPQEIQNILIGDGNLSNIFSAIHGWSDTSHFMMAVNIGATACYFWRENQPFNATNIYNSFSRTTVNAGIDLIVCSNHY